MLDAVKKDSENRLTIAMSAARPIRMPMFCLNQAKKRPLNFLRRYLISFPSCCTSPMLALLKGNSG